MEGNTVTPDQEPGNRRSHIGWLLIALGVIGLATSGFLIWRHWSPPARATMAATPAPAPGPVAPVAQSSALAGSTPVRPSQPAPAAPPDSAPVSSPEGGSAPRRGRILRHTFQGTPPGPWLWVQTANTVWTRRAANGQEEDYTILKDTTLTHGAAVPGTIVRSGDGQLDFFIPRRSAQREPSFRTLYWRTVDDGNWQFLAVFKERGQ